MGHTCIDALRTEFVNTREQTCFNLFSVLLQLVRLYVCICNQCRPYCPRILRGDESKTAVKEEVMVIEPVVRKVDSAIHRIVTFQKAMIPGILNSQEIKTDFNFKTLKFNVGFTSYRTGLEILTKITTGWITLLTFRTTDLRNIELTRDQKLTELENADL